VSKNGKYGFIDKTGMEVIPLEYDRANPFADGLAAVSIDDKWGYINTSGEIVIPLEYDRGISADRLSFVNGLAVVCIGKIDREDIYNNTDDRKYGIIDIEGNIVLPIEYDMIYSADRFYRVAIRDKYKRQKWGLADMSGEFILPCIYDSIRFDTDNGLLYVEQNGKWGILEIENYKMNPFDEQSIRPSYDMYDMYNLYDWDSVDWAGNETLIIPYLW